MDMRVERPRNLSTLLRCMSLVMAQTDGTAMQCFGRYRRHSRRGQHTVKTARLTHMRHVPCKITAAQNQNDPDSFAPESDRVSFDGGFLPVNTGTWPIRNFDFAVLDPERLLHNGIGPVLPLEPVRGLGSAH